MPGQFKKHVREHVLAPYRFIWRPGLCPENLPGTSVLFHRVSVFLEVSNSVNLLFFKNVSALKDTYNKPEVVGSIPDRLKFMMFF